MSHDFDPTSFSYHGKVRGSVLLVFQIFRVRLIKLFCALWQAVVLTLFLVSPALLASSGGCPDCHHRPRRSLRFLRNIFDRVDRVLHKPVEVTKQSPDNITSWDCSGWRGCHQHRPVLTDSAEEDLHGGWGPKYLHQSLWAEMLLLHLS